MFTFGKDSYYFIRIYWFITYYITGAEFYAGASLIQVTEPFGMVFKI